MIRPAEAADLDGWQALLAVRAARGNGPAVPQDRPLAELYGDFAAAGPDRPRVYGHLGQSLDGCIATVAGDSHYVTGPDNLDHLHRMRALADAVVVGAGTVVADDPQLTTRRVPGPNPVRVVLDPRGRLTAGLGLLEDGAAPTLVMSPRPAPPAAAHVEWVGLAPGPDGLLPPRAVVGLLRGRGLHALFVEGGGATVSSFLAAGALDRLQICVAPVVVGAGRKGVSLAPSFRMADALRAPARAHVMGDDVLFDLDLEGVGP